MHFKHIESPQNIEPHLMSTPASPVATSAIADLALSDLALDAAIELERLRANKSADVHSVAKLANALSDDALTDLALVPVYDRALTSTGSIGPSSKSDLFSRLQSIAEKMQATDSATPEDIDLIRDFCIALHDALLTVRLQTLRQPTAGQKRAA